MAAAERLGYVANASARTLKQRTSWSGGRRGRARGREPVLRDARRGDRADAARGRPPDGPISDNEDSLQELAGARTFLAMRAAGVIVTAVSSEAAELLVRNGIPVVEVDRRLAHVPCDAVVIDNEQGARAATSTSSRWAIAGSVSWWRRRT